LIVLSSDDVEFGVAWEVGIGSFRRDLFEYYDDLSNNKMVEDLGFYVSILIVRTNIYLKFDTGWGLLCSTTTPHFISILISKL